MPPLDPHQTSQADHIAPTEHSDPSEPSAQAPEATRPLDPSEHLSWLQQRRSTRRFSDAPISQETVERLLQAAITAPSNTNRQPWRFAVVRSVAQRQALAQAVRERVTQMKEIIARSHHAQSFANYGDFFHEPLQEAQLIIIPQYREHQDLIAQLIESGGGDPEQFDTARAMQAELCSTCGAIMTLLIQAHAEGLGACWMAGPMVARAQIEELLQIKAPWRMVGGIALGYPLERPEPKPRKSLERVVEFF